jgi:hypothetical protein
VTCVRGYAADLSLACVALPNLTLCFLCDLYCKGHNVEVGKCYLAEPWDKNRVSLVAFSVIVVFTRTRFKAT